MRSELPRLANNDALWDHLIISSDWASFFWIICLMASIRYSSKHLEGNLICFHKNHQIIYIYIYKKKNLCPQPESESIFLPSFWLIFLSLIAILTVTENKVSVLRIQYLTVFFMCITNLYITSNEWNKTSPQAWYSPSAPAHLKCRFNV